MLPNDPDQYALWHEDQANSITLLSDKRIDKLLEDGRQTINQDDRKQIYDDFQKYLSDRVPAVFLYFPYEYTISRNNIEVWNVLLRYLRSKVLTVFAGDMPSPLMSDILLNVV